MKYLFKTDRWDIILSEPTLKVLDDFMRDDWLSYFLTTENKIFIKHTIEKMIKDKDWEEVELDDKIESAVL